MFNPIPPQEPAPPRAEAAEVTQGESLFPGRCRRILGFAVKRGVVLALILGGPLGLLIGLMAPSPTPAFLDDPFMTHGNRILFWAFATFAAFVPCMIFACAIAMSADEIVRNMARSSRRTALTLKKCLERRFDSHR